MNKYWLAGLFFWGIGMALLGWSAGYHKGYQSGYASFQPRVITTTVYRYPNTPPYEAIPDPINLEQALALLYGMRASHEAALNWTFESSPGFGIDDKDFQRTVIKWYDQLIDFVRREVSN